MARIHRLQQSVWLTSFMLEKKNSRVVNVILLLTSFKFNHGSILFFSNKYPHFQFNLPTNRAISVILISY